MPKFPVIQTQVADPSRAAQYSAPNVVPVQPQEPQQLQRLGQAMEQAGQQFSALAADRERRINLAAHTEREAAAQEAEIAKFSEFEQLEGQAAVKAFKSYSDEMVKRHEAAVRSAPEGPQREWLQNSLRQMRVRLLNSATSHRDKELRTWRIGGASASLQQSIKTAIAMHGSPDDDSNAQDVADKARELAALQGASDEQTNMLVAQGISDMHVGRVDKMLADPARTAEAAAYLATHKNEISQESYDKTEKVTKAAVIEGTARELTSNFYRFEDRLKWVNEKFQGSADDKESLRRHLMQQANLQDAADAQVAADVEKRARQWMAENPELDIMRDAPELAAEVTRYGVDVRRTRTTNQKWLDEFYAAPTSRLDSLRALDDNQLHRYLSSRLDAHDEATVTKFLRGDQSGASIGERTKVLARQLGILPSDNRDARPEENRAFDAWVANTIDPMLRKSRDQLKRDLNADDFQKLIVDPIMRDKVWTDAGRNRQLPLMQLQQEKLAPVDDPLTPKDESLDFDAYNSLYVEVGGQQVYLREVPLVERKRIRDAWSILHPGEQMTVEAEVAKWVKNGRIGDLKPAQQAEKQTAGMVGKDEWPVKIGPSRLDHVWSDGKTIRQGSTAAPK